MSSWVWLAIVLVALFLVYAWFSDRRSAKRQAKWEAEAAEHHTSEENVIQVQASLRNACTKLSKSCCLMPFEVGSFTSTDTRCVSGSTSLPPKVATTNQS